MDAQHLLARNSGLREALYSAITEIKSLKDKNKVLKEQKRRNRTQAHIDTLYQLTIKEKELQKSEQQWKSRCDALEASLIYKTNQLQKLTVNTKEQEQLVKKAQEEEKLKEELQEEMKQKDDLLKRAIQKRRNRTQANMDTLYQRNLKEKELQKSEQQWKIRCDALEASLIPKINQLQPCFLHQHCFLHQAFVPQ
ncbi:hypothetical protein D9C73_024443 [Collichthys lucidus]|uniref:Uncharacterized protein n=1 Tax=Collichthys lucidus TaxID=240159 RepID=A0A4V6AVP2_COLLU|nr:hypothetical protein D9C73_024443 [Collichthys lucidus]